MASHRAGITGAVDTATGSEERRAQRGSTSLVSYHQTLPAESESESCPSPRDGVRFFNLDTGEVRPVPCGRLKCPTCASYLAWKRSVAMAWARPQRRFELTQVGDDWDTVRARMFRLRHDIAAAGIEHEWSWMVEPNPAGTGHHVHGYQRGDYIPQHQLSKLADRRGLGMVTYIKAMREHAATGYGLKALTYGLKGVTREESHAQHLELNGGRLSHHSRGFYGVRVRDAERQALEIRRSGEREWVVTSVAELDRMMPRRAAR